MFYSIIVIDSIFKMSFLSLKHYNLFLFFLYHLDLDPMVSDAMQKWKEKSGQKTTSSRYYQKALDKAMEYREEVERRKKARGIVHINIFHI